MNKLTAACGAIAVMQLASAFADKMKQNETTINIGLNRRRQSPGLVVDGLRAGGIVSQERIDRLLELEQIARCDDWHRVLVGSDVRVLVGEALQLHTQKAPPDLLAALEEAIRIARRSDNVDDLQSVLDKYKDKK